MNNNWNSERMDAVEVQKYGTELQIAGSWVRTLAYF
jgi:hypothetical protein